MNKLEVKNKLKDNKSPERWKRIRLKEVAEYEQPQKYIVSDERYDKSMGIPVLTAGKSFILGYTDEQFGICKNLPVIIFDDFTTDSRYINFPFKLKSSAIKILKTRNNGCNLFFIYNVMQNLNFKPGSGHKRFWISEYSKISILYPPLPEQQKIAEILETVDETIKKSDVIIEKYKRIKQGLMQDLLTRGIDENGQIRSEKTHRFKDSPLGRIPEEWEAHQIADIANVTKLAGFEFTNYFRYRDDGEIIALRALNIKNRKLDLTDIQRIKKKVSEQLPRSQVNAGDILITYIGAYIGDTLIIKESNKYHLAPNVAKITAKSIILPEFLEIFLSSYIGKRQYKRFSTLTATPSLTMTQIRKIVIFFPTEKEQHRIVSIFSQIDKTIEKEQNYKEKLERIKQGLMEDLLTGKVRVNHLIKEGAESV